MIAHTKGHKEVSGISDPAFMTKGFHNWIKYGERFSESSKFSKDYEGLSVRTINVYHGLMKQMLIQMNIFKNSYH